MAASNGFIRLAELLDAASAPTLVPRAPAASAPPVPTRPSGEPVAQPASSPDVAASAIPTEPIAEFLARDVRLFRAALAEALDVLAGELAARLAAEVLGRELLLAPADLAAIAARLLTEHAADEPLRLRVAPGQAQAVESILPVIEDSHLASGDAVLECRGGSVDARLTVRLATLVAWLAP